MNSFDGNVSLVPLMRIKAQTNAKIWFMNCKCCVAERTWCLCLELNYEVMTYLLNNFCKDMVLLHKSTGYEG